MTPRDHVYQEETWRTCGRSVTKEVGRSAIEADARERRGEDEKSIRDLKELSAPGNSFVGRDAKRMTEPPETQGERKLYDGFGYDTKATCSRSFQLSVKVRGQETTSQFL